MGLHKKFQKFTENPLLAILSPESVEALKKKILPLFIYELEQGGSGFLRLDYELATSDSERIAVDHVAKAVDTATSQTTSTMSNNMRASLNALKLLRRKVRFLIDIVKNSPEVQKNHVFMRRLQQIVAQLPIADRAAFEANAFPDYADVAAVNLLASVLKASELLNGLADDFKVYYQGDMRRGHMDGVNFDPSDVMFLGDEDGVNSISQMVRSQNPHERQPKGSSGLFNRIFK